MILMVRLLSVFRPGRGAGSDGGRCMCGAWRCRSDEIKSVWDIKEAYCT